MTPNKKTNQGSVPSSRDSFAGAGWHCQQPSSYQEEMPTGARRRHISWLDPRTLWQSRRNDFIARFLSDPVNDERRRWVAAQRQHPDVPRSEPVKAPLAAHRFMDYTSSIHSEFIGPGYIRSLDTWRR